MAADDTLASSPYRFHLSESALAGADQLGPAESLQGVEALAIPLAPVASSTRMVLYVVRKGDTLVTIADRFGVSLTQLRRWNKISGVKVEPGRRLHVAEPTVVASSSAPSRRHGHYHQAKSSTSPVGEKPLPVSPSKGQSVAGRRSTPKSHSNSNPATGATTGARKKHSNKQAANQKSSSQ